MGPRHCHVPYVNFNCGLQVSQTNMDLAVLYLVMPLNTSKACQYIFSDCFFIYMVHDILGKHARPTVEMVGC